MKVRPAARKISFRRPRMSPIQEQERAPKRAPMVKVATTAPCLVELLLFSAPVVSMVLISGKWSFQSRRERRPPTPDWLYPNSTKAGRTTSKSCAVWRVFPVSPMVTEEGGRDSEEKKELRKRNGMEGSSLLVLQDPSPQYLQCGCHHGVTPVNAIFNHFRLHLGVNHRR